jgi:uncharacterized protein YndB with AHSA1/START domain
MTVEVATVIAASPERVWEFVEPIERHVDWMTDAVSITFTSAQHRGVGTAFECVTKVGPFRTNDRMVVTEWDPPNAMGIEHRGLFTGSGRFTLRPEGDGHTRFTWTERLQFPWWLGGTVGASAAEPVLRRVWAGNLRRLERLVASSLP